MLSPDVGRKISLSGHKSDKPLSTPITPQRLKTLPCPLLLILATHSSRVPLPSSSSTFLLPQNSPPCAPFFFCLPVGSLLPRRPTMTQAQRPPTRKRNLRAADCPTDTGRPGRRNLTHSIGRYRQNSTPSPAHSAVTSSPVARSRPFYYPSLATVFLVLPLLGVRFF